MRSLTAVAGGVGGYESPAEVPAVIGEAVEAMEVELDWEALSDWGFSDAEIAALSPEAAPVS